VCVLCVCVCVCVCVTITQYNVGHKKGFLSSGERRSDGKPEPVKSNSAVKSFSAQTCL